MKTRFSLLFICFCALILLPSCLSQKEQGRSFLVRRNTLKVDKPYIAVSELESFINPKPSPRFLLSGRWNQVLYDRTGTGRNSRFKRWIHTTLVRKPVYLDTNIANQSCRQLKLYLDNIGHFHADVSKTVNYGRNTAAVHYRIRAGEAFRIKDIQWTIRDTAIRALVLGEDEPGLLKPGDIYNAYTLDNERTRITLLLKQYGYFAFAKEYINFRVDTNLPGNLLNISAFIADPAEAGQNPADGRHPRYTLANIDIFPDYDPYRLSGSIPDTAIFIEKEGDNIQQYRFISYQPMRLNKAVLTNSLFLKSGNLFNIRDFDQSYNRLDELQFFRYIKFTFQERLPDSLKSGITGNKELDCTIHLSPGLIHAYSIVAEGTNSGGDLGLASNFIYQNRNLFRGAEQLTLTLKGAMEVQQRLGELTDSEKNRFFNAFEAGAYARLLIPKFLLPVDPSVFSRYFRPKSTLTLGFNYQDRLSYQRYLMEGSFGYEWRESRTRKHLFNPFEISSISIFPDTTFINYLDSVNDDRLRDQYTDHFIMSLKYSFVFNNQQINKRENFYYFRADMEVAGNFLNMMNQFLEGKKDENGNYILFGLRYSQYLKSQADFRYYNILGKGTMVFRASAGIGVPYGNSDGLPFDKGFYAGGANGMRGWPIRSLGPGSVSAGIYSLNTERMGEILIESNLEYRFPIASFFNGALFADAGNIWLLRANDQYPGGEFRRDLFFKELAIDAGFGLRLDFGFFVFRLDGAIPLRDPALDISDRWIKPRYANLTDVMWNLGIGYPF